MNPNMMKQIPSFEFRRYAMAVIKPLMSVLIVIALIAALPGLISSTVLTLTEADPSAYIQPVTSKLTTYALTGDASPYGQGETADDSAVLDIYTEEMNAALAAFMEEKGAIFIPMTLLNLLLSPALMILLTRALINAVRKREVSLADSLRMLRYSPKALLVELWMIVRMYVWMLPGIAVMLIAMLLVMIAPSMVILGIALLLIFAGMIASVVLGVRAGLHYCLASVAFAEDPTLSINACIRESWQVMRRRKMEFFFLQVSFVGWHLLVSVVMLFASMLLGAVVGSAVGMMANLILSVYISTAQVLFYLSYSGKLGSVKSAGAPAADEEDMNLN